MFLIVYLLSVQTSMYAQRSIEKKRVNVYMVTIVRSPLLCRCRFEKVYK